MWRGGGFLMSRLGGLRRSLRGVQGSCQCLMGEMRCSRHSDHRNERLTTSKIHMYPSNQVLSKNEKYLQHKSLRHRDRNPAIIYIYSVYRSHSRDHNTGRYNSFNSQQGSLEKSSHRPDSPDNPSRHVQDIAVLPLSHALPYSMVGFSLNCSLYQPRIPFTRTDT